MKIRTDCFLLILLVVALFSSGCGGGGSKSPSPPQPPTNQAPVITSLTADPESGDPPLNVTFTCTATDQDGDQLTYEWKFEESTSFTKGEAVITHPYDESGNYTATVRVSDGINTPVSRSIVIGVNIPGNKPPVAVDDVAIIDEDAINGVTIDVLANDSDPDGDVLDFIITGDAMHGGAGKGFDPKKAVYYVHHQNYHGTDTFTYQLMDRRGGIAYGNVTVTINPVNDSPVLNFKASGIQGATPFTVTFTADATDVDGDTLQYSWNFGDGTTKPSGNSIETHTYTSKGNYHATVTVSDGNGGVISDGVDIKVGVIVAEMNTLRGNDIVVDGNYAFLAGSGGLQIIDVSNPRSPKSVATIETPGTGESVFIQEGYAYVSDWDEGLRVIDISNPLNPILKGALKVPNSIYTKNSVVVGDYAYVAADFEFSIINVSNPDAPSLVSNISGDNWRTECVRVRSNTAYITCSGSVAFKIMDVSDPASIKLYGSVPLPYIGWDIELQGNYAYVACGEEGVQIININNPNSPAIVGEYDTPGQAKDIFIQGNNLFVADDKKSLQILDISNPTSPVYVGWVDISKPPATAGAEGVFVVNEYAFVADYWGRFFVIDLASFDL